MMGKGSHVFAVMGYIIAKTIDSHVTLKPDYLAFVIGDTEHRIKEAIEFLSSPDPESTGKEHEGRRIVPVGDVAHEYFVPRHEYYRGIRTSDDVRQATLERVRRFRKKDDDSGSAPEKNGKQQIVIPDALKTESFLKVWNDWLAHLKEKRKNPTSLAIKQQLCKLSMMGAARAIECIQHSIANNYQGLFEPNGSSAKPQSSPKYTPPNPYNEKIVVPRL